MDPLLDLVQLLRPRATLWRRIEAAGHWAITFPVRNDLLFCSVAAGSCLLLYGEDAPLPIVEGDFLLLYTAAPFRLASDAEAEPLDSMEVLGPAMPRTLQLGEGRAGSVVIDGGRFVFHAANRDLLTALLTRVLHVPAGQEFSSRIQSLLRLIAAESGERGSLGEFILPRLMEVLLVELLRTRRPAGTAEAAGMLAGLANPILGRVLHAMHGEVAHGWTVAELGRLVGMSRSSLASLFRRVVGKGPIEYLQDWRMALAREALVEGRESLEEIALRIGFQSASAFSTAFRRALGCPPRAFSSGVRSGARGGSLPRASKPQI